MQTALILIAVLFAISANASCVLPVPDGGDTQPNSANIHGQIANVQKHSIVVVEKKTRKRVEIVLPKNAEIYSVFGGDVAQAELAVGQTVWIWFSRCKWPAKTRPTSAYLQIYSLDPQDQP